MVNSPEISPGAGLLEGSRTSVSSVARTSPKRARGVLPGIWAGPVGFLLFGIGTGPMMSNFVKPPAPTLSAAGIAAIYSANPDGIRLGAITVMCAGCLLLAFFATISGQLRRIEEKSSPYAYTQLAAGTIAAMLFVIGSVLWCVAALRPDRSPDLTLLVSDIACVFLTMPGPIGVIQNLPIALAIYSDRNPVPLFPRWLGHLNIITAILFIPGVFVVYYQTGPLAWNGLLAYWVPAIAFAVWLVAMTWGMLKSVKRVALYD